MLSASAIRIQVESALANKIPSALTPVAKMVRPVVSSGIESLDTLLRGGLPVGAVSEVTGPECSGRTSLVGLHTGTRAGLFAFAQTRFGLREGAPSACRRSDRQHT